MIEFFALLLDCLQSIALLILSLNNTFRLQGSTLSLLTDTNRHPRRKGGLQCPRILHLYPDPHPPQYFVFCNLRSGFLFFWQGGGGGKVRGREMEEKKTPDTFILRAANRPPQ